MTHGLSPELLSCACRLNFPKEAYSILRSTGIVDLDRGTACWFFGHDVGQAYLTSPATGSDEVVIKLIELSKDCVNVDTYLEHMRNKLLPERTDGT
jgi:hypothetical protein